MQQAGAASETARVLPVRPQRRETTTWCMMLCVVMLVHVCYVSLVRMKVSITLQFVLRVGDQGGGGGMETGDGPGDPTGSDGTPPAGARGARGGRGRAGGHDA